MLAVSVDSKFTLRAYAEKEGYGFDLLADFWPHGGSGRAVRRVRSRERDGPARNLHHRRGGIVRYVVVNPRGQARDLAEYRAALAGLGGS